MAGSGGGKPGALPCRSMLCADVPRALQVGAFVHFLEALPCLRLAQQIACTPSWPPLLPALSCACARRAMVLVSGDGRAQALTLAAAVLCACILVPARFTCSGRCPTWTPLATFLATAELRLERLRSWLPRPCWLPELRPCSLHT